MQYKVLLVEDDQALLEALVETLALAKIDCIQASSAEAAIVALKAHPINVVVSDIQMSGMDGIGLLRYVQQNFQHIPVLLMTAYADVNKAVEAMKLGALDYLVKPFSPEVLLNQVSRFMPMHAENSEIIAADPKSVELFQLAKKVAQSDASVMISGPSGAGKEVFAHYIHQASPRYKKSFVAINCAAIPENMLEATLFGYEKGAYTGAYQACPGKFEQAQEGTLLLDEISEMALGLQAKLLRVLQEKEVERLGSRKTIPLDVRVIATSNRDLKACVEAKTFREDLYYRLNVFPLMLPPLVERPQDILPLVQFLLRKHGQPFVEIDDGAQAKLQNYTWPGNVRELDNVIQRALILHPHGAITKEDIVLEHVEATPVIEPKSISSLSSPDIPDTLVDGETLNSSMRMQEYQIILEALQQHQGCRKDVAQKLGISTRTLRYKLANMRDLGIELPVS
ncbi:MAG: sigma-54-dependent Fis family transcriptional regulator [Shewanellaceae bacterium]|nr:sigma-54-dependent Fis family transcriptional regulator [Shewanellaceae bacterium]